MAEYVNKELSFENTPLQNLKNILSDADASRGSDTDTSQTTDFHGVAYNEQEIVSKSDLRQAVNDVLAISGTYISASALGQLACRLCASEQDELVFKKGALNNSHIKKMDEIIKIQSR